MSNRRCTVRFAVALILSSAAFLSHAQTKPPAVTIGFLNLVNAQLLAKGLGLHEKEMGVPVKWIKFGGGGDVNRAVAADQLDFGSIGNPPSSIGITRDLAYEGILVLNMLGAVESLVVRQSKNITSLKDLVGKVVAAPFGTTTHYLLLTALRDASVNATEVKILDMSPQDAFAAWMRKDIDAAYVWEPALGRMVQSDGRLMLGSDEMAKRGYPTWDISVVMRSFASKYPDLVVKFIKSECEAIEFWNKKPDESAAIIAKELSLTLEEAKRMMKGTGMVPCADQLKDAYLGTSVKKGKFVDTLVATATFLKEQNRLPLVKDRSAYDAFINPSYIERYLKK